MKKADKLPFDVVKVNYNIAKLIVPAPQNEEFSLKILAMADSHLESSKSDNDLFHNLCGQAKEEKAAILIDGDFLDGMSGPDDRRGARSTLRNEISRKKYFDDIVDYGVKALHPYRYNLVMLGTGNHELRVEERYGTNLTERIVSRLVERGSPVVNGHYSGWLDIKFSATGKNQNTQVNRIFYHHGSGYSSPAKVREACGEMPDADVFLFGHTHRHWLERLNRKRRTNTGIFDDDQLILGIPGMKDDTIDDNQVKKKNVYGSKAEGWAVEKGHRSKMLGAWWLIYRWSRYFRRYVVVAQEAIPK